LQHFESAIPIPVVVDCFRIDNPRTRQPMNIATVSRDLRAVKQAETHLRHLDELEQRLTQCTIELAAANQRLAGEIEERGRADARSQQLQHELSHAGRLSTAGQMAAELAHEINQPLTAITNSLNAARRLLAGTERDKIDTVHEIMGEVVDQSLRAGEIIRSLREFLSRGEMEKTSERVTTLVEEANAFVQAGSTISAVEVERDFDTDVSTVFANRIQIQQVLVNLIRNAIEAMARSDSRVLRLSTRRLDAGTVEIAVGDCGPGISRDVARHLFQPFFSTKRDGMGLGLSICRSIVSAHGGELRVEPSPTGGTIFRFTLPSLGESDEE
jgi:C4-dicarboxylate-specific signal transduction histidine kinase